MENVRESSVQFESEGYASFIRIHIGSSRAGTSVAACEKARTALEKKRSLVASAYGAVEIGQCLNAVFGDIYIMLMTFDTAELKRNWNALCEKLRVNVSMPKNYAMADDVSCAAEPSVAVEGLGQFFRHVSRDALLSPPVSQHVILGQLEITLNNGEVWPSIYPPIGAHVQGVSAQ